MPRFSIWQELQNGRKKDCEQKAKASRCHQKKGGIEKACQSKKDGR
jgi:hypothetical protein